MAEIPANVLLAEEFAARFDGFSIGSNDLAQLILGIDRGSSALAPLFDERRPAVKQMIRDLIHTAHRVAARWASAARPRAPTPTVPPCSSRPASIRCR
jgi:pyruvate,water dikinase